MSNKILVVDDEKSILNIIAFNLKKEGFSVVCAEDGEQALEVFKSEQPELVLLDVMMPKIDGYGVCKEIRKFSQVPIIMLTARADEMDKVQGLDLGADDYVTKPFSNKELIARVKANIRRSPLQVNNISSTSSINTISESGEEAEININNNNKFNVVEYSNVSKPSKDLEDLNQKRYDDLILDFEREEVFKRKKLVNLTTREFELLKFLCLNINKIFTREQLLSEVWGYQYLGDIRSVDVGIRRLREKLEDDASKPKYILTKRGIGYYFCQEKILYKNIKRITKD